MNEKLSVIPGRPYFCKDGKPFFWLGDTAWLLFVNLTDEQAYAYLENRKSKGFNVVQATLIHFAAKTPDENEYFRKEEYWRHVDNVVKKAEELGIYMALLPSWGGVVKQGTLNLENVDRYAAFLNDRFSGRHNIIWLLGGDIKPDGLEDYYARLAGDLKNAAPDRLVGFHPFGRCSSSLWFNDAPWLDFNMFQSGHRRYDQCQMGAWDDTSNIMSLNGEDNWKYVLHDLGESRRPVLDGEPSYENIPQGLHDDTQPYWTAHEVRRYAYWSVLAGAAGHTYGHNAIMQFYDSSKGKKGSYGVKDDWRDAMDHPGAFQMQYVKRLVESVDFTHGCAADELVLGGQRERHERVAVLAGADFLIAYSFTGKEFSLDVRKLAGKRAYLMNPATGEYSDAGEIAGDSFTYTPSDKYEDVVVLIK